MTKYEEMMVILLQNASNEISCDCNSTKQAKEKIDSFLNSFLIPKEEFNQLFTILKLDSLKDARALFFCSCFDFLALRSALPPFFISSSSE